MQCKKCGLTLTMSNTNTETCHHEIFYPIYRDESYMPTKEYIKQIKIKNIIAFLSIIFSEDELILSSLFKKSPDYLLEKYERYLNSNKDESLRGMHPALRKQIFNKYCEKWNIKIEINEVFNKL